MTSAGKQDRGRLRVDQDECKGCALCIEACPPHVIQMTERLNHYGYRTDVCRSGLHGLRDLLYGCVPSREPLRCCASPAHVAASAEGVKPCAGN